ncbi:MAG: hypothetical protein AB7I27_00335 [Bacteriovoracaceae bacterium]
MNNDQEWRNHLFSEIREIRNDLKEMKLEMTSLKIKVATFSSVIGSFAGYFMNKFFS